jgi:3'5'-cyclic nucleotide phosphodiesterase
LDKNSTTLKNTKLGEEVQKQLRELIAFIAENYKNHSYHNFVRASHIVMSTTTLLERIQTAFHPSNHKGSKENVQQFLYLDQLSKLGFAFSALVSEIDHFGLSNKHLVNGEYPIAKVYNKTMSVLLSKTPLMSHGVSL